MKKLFTVKRIILAVVVIGAAVGGYLFLSRDKNTVSYITEAVRVGNITRVVNATGEIGSANLVSVGAQVSGQIEKLYVQLGQEVKRGDMIAQIDSTTQQNELAINKSKLESLVSQLESANVSLRTAQADYNRELRMSQSSATSQANLEAAEKALAAAKASVKEYESQVQQARISVNNSETNLGYTKITAPLDGIVVSVPVREGQTVNANQSAPTIVQVADLSQMEILIQISEADVTKVNPGMAIRYTVLSNPGKIYNATLDSIDPGLTTLSTGTYTGVIDSNAAIYYYGRSIVPNEDGRLRIGMTTQNSIVTESAENVLIVPTITITTQGESKFVNVLENGVPVRKEITTGITDNLNTEVTSGLRAGDRIISSQMTSQEINQATTSNTMRMRL